MDHLKIQVKAGPKEKVLKKLTHRKTDAPKTDLQIANLRLDLLLWRLRFFKNRALARKTVEKKRIRINGVRTVKPHHAVRCGDTLTFAIGDTIHAISIDRIPHRRGPAIEAQNCYTDLIAQES